MRRVLFAALAFWAAAAPETTGKTGRQEQTIVLQGQVWSEGHPVPSAEVALGDGEEQSQATLTDDQGRFRFRVAPGRYWLAFRMTGFYETVLNNVEIGAQPLEELIVHLSPRLRTEPHEPLVSGPERIPAPELHLRFAADPLMGRGQVITGRVSLRNVGETLVWLPRERISDRTDSGRFLRMNLVVSSTEYQALFNGWYSCLPPQGCEQLAPSASIDLPVTLFKRSGEQNEPQVYHRRGEFPVTVAVVFVPPGEAEKRTDPIQATYLLRVAW